VWCAMVYRLPDNQHGSTLGGTTGTVIHNLHSIWTGGGRRWTPLTSLGQAPDKARALRRRRAQSNGLLLYWCFSTPPCDRKAQTDNACC
jgi:hypothetical protein